MKFFDQVNTYNEYWNLIQLSEQDQEESFPDADPGL
jgi:hypothetical protein